MFLKYRIKELNYMPKSSKKKITKKKVSMKELMKKTHSRNAVRTGSTDEIKSRIQQYKKKYPDAKVNYAKTTNKEKAENILLKQKNWPDNKQTESNADKKSGYVYVVSKKKNKSKKGK